MQHRDHKQVSRERLSSSGGSISEFSDDEAVLDTKDVNDPRLLKAASAAVQEKSITPLIKEELRLSILNRRSKEGLEDIKIDQEKKVYPKKPLTPQEHERKMRRQEQNRRAARKCRKKKKDNETLLLEAYKSEKEKKISLAQQVDDLKKEKAKLLEEYNKHLEICSMGHNNSQLLQTLPQKCKAPSTVTKADDEECNTPVLPDCIDHIPFTYNEVISPGLSEPFTPNTDNDQRYFMYPDNIQTGSNNDCKTSTEQMDFPQDCMDISMDECFHVSGGTAEQSVDIQSYLANERLVGDHDVPGHHQLLPASNIDTHNDHTMNPTTDSDLLRFFSEIDTTDLLSEEMQDMNGARH